MKAFSTYTNPALAVDIVVFGYAHKRLSVLLMKRGEAPYKDQWTLPGAFLQIDETLIEACSRVLITKLGSENIFLEQLYTFDQPGRDPRGRVVSVGYFALVSAGQLTIAASTAGKDVRWIDAQELPTLGFDHTHIFQTALSRLKAKILYHPVGFELLDDLFTMTELQDLYECILDTTLDRRNFRRKILESEFVINTGKKREGLPNRHPDLFRFNKKLKKNNFHLNIHIS